MWKEQRNKNRKDWITIFEQDYAYAGQLYLYACKSIRMQIRP